MPSATIYKYPIEIVDLQRVTTAGPKVLHVGLDPNGVPCIWVEVLYPEEKQKYNKMLFVVGTGNPIPPLATHYLGSFVQGSFVWHVYES